MTTITITGLTATEPRFLITNDGVPIASFRFASTDRRYNRATEKWEDGDTTWFTVSAFRGLAENVRVSVKKGERLIITGRPTYQRPPNAVAPRINPCRCSICSIRSFKPLKPNGPSRKAHST